MSGESDTEPVTTQPGAGIVGAIAARRGALTVVGLLVGFGVIANGVWQFSRPSLAQSERYRVTAASLEVNPAPAWIGPNVVADALARQAAESPLSLLDPPERLESSLRAALTAHPFVRDVNTIERLAGGRLRAELSYRAPIAAVLTPEGLAPIDAEAVRLPTTAVPDAGLRRLPRIGYSRGNLKDTRPGPLPTNGWPTDAVHGAAALIAAFGDAWSELGLFQVQITAVGSSPADATYDLLSIGNTIVHWGAAPGRGPAGEASFDVKLTRLRTHIAEVGPLTEVSRETSKAVDVRNGIERTKRFVRQGGTRVAERQEPEPDAVK